MFTGDPARYLSVKNNLQFMNTMNMYLCPQTTLIRDTLTCRANQTISEAFACAINQTATSFSLFDDHFLQHLLAKLRPAWKPPREEVIGEALLDDSCNPCMKRTIMQFQKAVCGRTAMDGA